MHDIDRDVPQSADMVENVVVVAVGHAVGIEKPAIDHVVDQDPGSGQGVFLVWLAVTVFIAVEAAGAAFPGYAGRCGFRPAPPFRLGPRRRGKYLGQPLDDIAAVFRSSCSASRPSFALVLDAEQVRQFVDWDIRVMT
jgi:hypothetical protein